MLSTLEHCEAHCLSPCKSRVTPLAHWRGLTEPFVCCIPIHALLGTACVCRDGSCDECTVYHQLPALPKH